MKCLPAILISILSLTLSAEDKPNFIFILSDDIAQGDLGAYGQELIQTPNLDQLAAEGTRYMQAYCGTTVCAPSRASFFTGQHAGRSPIRGNYELPPEGQYPIPDETVTIAEVAKAAGYATSTFGKWGMGFYGSSGAPANQGVDHFFGYNCQRLAHSYFPTYLHDNDQPFLLPGNNGREVGETFAQDLIQRDMIQWVRENKDEPFFMFYAITLPHGRHEIDDQGIYADKPWTELQKTYAAQVTRLDSDIGELVATLRELGIAENTVIVFSGDNGSSFGANSEIGSKFNQDANGLRGFKRGMYEGALRQAAIAWWPGTVPAGRVSDEPWAFWDLMPTFTELSGATPPEGYVTDGKSLVDFFKGGPAPERDYFYWELHENGPAVQAARWEDWKAVSTRPDKPIEIYNLAKDPGETTDLAGKKPELVQKAKAIFAEAHHPHPDWPLDKRSDKQKLMSKAAWKEKRERDRSGWTPPNAGPAPTGDESTPTVEDKPNIVVFMIDDLGWNHISAAKPTMGTQRSDAPTPNIEKLAQDGLSFTHAYAQPNCAPSRAAMLTGQYPARIYNDVYSVVSLQRYQGLSEAKRSFDAPEQSEDVAPEAITVAEALKKNGYATAHIGKYHVGNHEGGEATMPENAGFDINFGGCEQGHQKSNFGTKTEDGWEFAQVGRGDFDRYAAPYTEEYLTRNGFPLELAGTPKHITDATCDALEDTVANLAAKDQPFYIQYHAYAVHTPLKARPDLKRAAEANDAPIADYTGFIAGFDENMRRLRNRLEDPNGDGDTSDSITEQTLILFTSDNGGWFGGNKPLRGQKGNFTEGGIRVPLIACWPGVIDPGGVTDHLVHLMDFYPTYLELAGKDWVPPTETHPIDGHSFAAALHNPAKVEAREPIFYLFPGYLGKRAMPCAVVLGDVQDKRYKLTYHYEGDSWELYCITDDPGESENLIESHREIAVALSKQLHDWLSKEEPTWNPKFPLHQGTQESAGPPPVLEGRPTVRKMAEDCHAYSAL